MAIERVEVFLLEFPLARRRLLSTGGNDSRGAAASIAAMARLAAIQHEAFVRQSAVAHVAVT